MIQLTSRAGNFSCPCAPEPRMVPAAKPTAALPAFIRTMRRSIPKLLLMPCSGSTESVRRRQPNSQALFERTSIQEVCQRHVLRHKASGVDEDALIVVLAALLRAGDELVDLGVELVARELSAFDHALELALQHVEFPTVDDDFIHLRPAGRVELPARQRDEGAAGLEPGLAAHHLARGGAADRDIGAAHDLLDRILGHDRNPKL